MGETANGIGVLEGVVTHLFYFYYNHVTGFFHSIRLRKRIKQHEGKKNSYRAEKGNLNRKEEKKRFTTCCFLKQEGR